MWPKNASTSHIIIFLAVTMLTSWGLAYAVAKSPNPIAISGMVLVIPTIAAIALNIIHHKGIMNVYPPVVTGTTAKSLIFAVLYPLAFVAVSAAVALIGRMAEFNRGNLPLGSDYLLHLVGIMLFMVIAFGEEYGWRGFLLPALAARFGQLKAALLVGLIWAAYHLPGTYFAASAFEAVNPWVFSLTQSLLLLVRAFPLAYCYFQTESSIISVILLRSVWDIAHNLVFGGTASDARTILAGNYLFFNTIPIELVLSAAAAVWFGWKLNQQSTQ